MCPFLLQAMLQAVHMEVTFQEIMHQYRHQPQAKSRVSGVSGLSIYVLESK